MPLTVRHVEPKHLYRKPLPDGIKNELHAVAVFSLAGAIRQISSLAKHAESMLGELCDTMSDIQTRSVLLDSRIARLRDKILPNLDVDEEGTNDHKMPTEMRAVLIVACVCVYI